MTKNTRLLILTLVFIFKFVHPLSATNYLDSRELVKKVVSEDFNGNPDGRFDRVIYLNGATASPEDCSSVVDCKSSGPRPESYSLENDEITIVSSWKLLDEPERFPDGELRYHVVFHTIAVTEGYGTPSWLANRGREIRLLSPSKDEVVIYSVRKDPDGLWKVINPPVPRVGIDAMVNYVRADLKHYSSPNVEAFWKRGGINGEKNLSIIKTWLSRQMNLLSSVDRLTP